MAILLTFLLVQGALASALYWPGYKWKTIHTDNFRIQYHQGERQLAYRVAVIAEETLAAFTARFNFKPWGKIEIVLSDAQDDSNGSSTHIPYNTVRLYAAPPHPNSPLDDYDDWLKMLITHELTHTVHMDMNRGAVKVLRWTFGRLIAFNHFSPIFEIEGLAVMDETIYSHNAGRGQSVFSDMIARGEWQSGDFPELDRLSSWTVSWPHGYRPYVLGGLFHKWVYDQIDKDVWYEIAQKHSGQIWPFMHNSNMAKTIGIDLKTAYKGWKSWLDQKYRDTYRVLEKEGFTPSRALTNTGEYTRRPKFSRDGKSLFWEEHIGRRKGRIRSISLENDKTANIKLTGETGSVAYMENGSITYTGAGAYQIWKNHYDVYMIKGPGKAAKRITKGLRARDIAPFPDGARVLFVANSLERPEIGILDLKSGKTTIVYTPEPEDDLIQFAQPAISPDGMKVAFSVWHNDGNRDIFLFDIRSREFRRLTFHAERDINPAFSPDGKYILFSSGRSGIYNIYALDIEKEKLFKVTNVFGGAFDPAVSPLKKWLAFSGYGPKGFDIHITPYYPDLWKEVSYTTLKDRGFGKCVIGRSIGQKALEVQDEYKESKYQGWRSIWPRYWRPSMGSVEGNLSLGMTTTGHDVLLRHIYSLAGLYSWESDFLSYGLSYTYARLRPNFTASHNHYSVYYGNVLIDQNGKRSNYYEERNAGAFSISFPLTSDFSIFLNYIIQDRRRLNEFPEGASAPIEEGLFSGFSTGVFMDTTTFYRESISPVDGAQAAITYTAFSSLFGADYEVRTLLGAYNHYFGLPFYNHVLAYRLTGGYAEGDELYLRAFRLGGFTNDQILAQPSENSVFLRGYNRASRRSQRVAAGSAEYRFPLWRPQRGISTWPIFLDGFSMLVFGDGGIAWSGDFGNEDFLPSAGAELHIRTIFAYYYPVQFRFGGAYGFVDPDIIGGLHWILTLGGSF